MAYNEMEICFAKHLDPLMLLRLDFSIISIVFQTTFLQERERRIGYKQRLAHGKSVGMTQQVTTIASSGPTHANVLRLAARSSPWGGTRDKPKHVCVGGYKVTVPLFSDGSSRVRYIVIVSLKAQQADPFLKYYIRDTMNLKQNTEAHFAS